MKKMFLLLLLIPLIGFSQDKNVVSTFRVFPKAGKTVEFEKALAEHAKKYHTGDWSWRVFEVQSGPEAGAYHVSEGPNSWTQLDGRGEINPEHQAHWRNTVEVLTDASRGGAGYSVYREEFSTAALTDWTEKVSITHLYTKPGCWMEIEANLTKAKKAWQANGESVAVYSSHFSGQPQYALVYRHKNGWKEKEKDYRKSFVEAYDLIYGKNEYMNYLEVIRNCGDRALGEMMILRKDLTPAM